MAAVTAALRRWSGRARSTRARVELARVSDRARHERRLGWKLTAPAFVVMLLVTAYPMLNALWLSLFSYRLTDPSGREFVGLRNYAVVLKDPLWWSDVGTTVLITAITVAVELVIGMAFALVMNGPE